MFPVAFQYTGSVLGKTWHCKSQQAGTVPALTTYKLDFDTLHVVLADVVVSLKNTSYDCTMYISFSLDK